MWQDLRYNVPITEAVSYGGEMIIKGTAINATVTRNGIKYCEEELRNSAHTLRNKPILKDHNNSVDSIVGRTTNNVNYNEGMHKIDFEGKIVDEMAYKKIRAGVINSVSVGAHVKDLVEESMDDGTKILKAVGIDFVEISLVGVPADPGALIENGFAYALTEAFKKKQDEMPKPEAVKHEETIQEIEEKIEPVVQEVIAETKVQEGENMEGIETQIKEKDAIIEKLQKELEESKKPIISVEPVVEQKVIEEKPQEVPALIEKVEKAQEQVIKIEQTEELKGKVNNEVEVKTSALDGYEIVKADSGYGFFKKEFSQKRLVR